MRAKEKLVEASEWDAIVELAKAWVPQQVATPVASPAAAPAASPAAATDAAPETPLKERLRRNCNRPGDGVQYGGHGTVGMYREAVKWATTEIAHNNASASALAKLLPQSSST